MVSPRIIGRDVELAWIATALDSVGLGRGGCLLLVGDPGVGKSRIVSEAADTAARVGVPVLLGRASPNSTSVPYQPLTAALLYASRAQELPSGPPVEALRPGLAALLPGFVTGPAVAPSPVLLGETMLRIAAALGHDRGAMIVLDDLQWADADTLAVTEYLADNAVDEPVVVIATLRPEGDALNVATALDRRGHASMRALAPLELSEVRAMAEACLGGGGPALDQLGAWLRSRTDGLPFLVEELLASLVSHGTLVASASGWELEGDLTVEVPLSFSQTVRERIVGLGSAGRRTLDAAAVLGRDFDWARVASISEQSETEVLDVFGRAIELQLVEPAGAEQFRFRHALTVDAIVAWMLDPQRMRLAARALAAVLDGASSPAPELVDLAAHLAVQAARPRTAAGYLADEAHRALAAGAITTAVATARRAVEIAPSDSPEAITSREALVAALSIAGDSGSVRDLGAELVVMLESSGASAERRARTILALARAATESLDWRRGRELCEQALALDPRDQRVRIELDLVVAQIAFGEHQHGAAVAAAESALRDADEGGCPDLACAALELLAQHQLLVELRIERAEAFLLAALERAEGAGLVVQRVQVASQLARIDVARHRGPGRIWATRAMAEEIGALAVVADLDHVLAIAYFAADRLDAAQQAAERAAQAAQRYHLEDLRAVVAGIDATILASRGDTAEAERRVDEALASADAEPLIRAAISGTALVVAALATDDVPRAAAHVAETRALLRATYPRIVIQPFSLGFFHGLAAVVVAASGATALVEGRDWAPVDNGFMRGSFLVAQAIVAGRAGDLDRADELFTEGDAWLEALPWVRAVYRRHAADAALADGWGDPGRWLDEAASYFEQRGDAALLRACRSLRRARGLGIRRVDPARVDRRRPSSTLTTRELDVLTLVVEGLTNKQIASRLYLSVRTVEKHVERILAKTGVANRTALAARVGGDYTHRPST
jgi:predicted ATPase/DNA-binding CsgD family transcriptional regulator